MTTLILKENIVFFFLEMFRGLISFSCVVIENSIKTPEEFDDVLLML